MKSSVFLFLVLAQAAAQAFSINTEQCWSAAPILKATLESKKLEIEQKLCAIDFYQGEYSICPKLNSTNPGVLVVKKLVDMPDEEFKQRYCSDVDEAKEQGKLKVAAKFKQTISCSNASSPVAYYRISEFLNGPRVPVAVFRTMDKSMHLELTLKANEYLAGKTDLIAQNWKNFLRAHQNPSRYPDLFIGSTVYGNLVENVKSEFKYSVISGSGPYGTRYQRFVQQKPFLLVANSASAISLAGGTSLQKLAPVVTQMKDVSNMIVTDYLLNQADRIGNIHFKYKWYKYENGEVTDESSETKYVNFRDVIPASEQEKAKAGEVLVKEMILKDNDCGISKDNEMKNIGALQLMRHMNPKFYFQLQKLAAFVATNEGENYFKNELRIPSNYFLGTANVSSVKGNIIEAAQILKANCQKGLLALDLKLEELLADPNYKASCEAE